MCLFPMRSLADLLWPHNTVDKRRNWTELWNSPKIHVMLLYVLFSEEECLLWVLSFHGLSVSIPLVVDLDDDNLCVSLLSEPPEHLEHMVPAEKTTQTFP